MEEYRLPTSFERRIARIMLNSTRDTKKTLLILAIVSAVSGLGLCIATELCLPIAAATLAVLYLYDSESQGKLSLGISVLVFVANLVAMFFIGGYSLVLAAEAIALACAIKFCYTKSVSKTATVLYTTVIAAIFMVLAFIAIPVIIEGALSADVVKAFYTELYDSLKQVFVSTVKDIYASLYATEGGAVIGADDIELIFERAAYMLISLVVICALIISGITLKIFSAFVTRLDSEPMRVAEWKFEMPVIYGYFFMALSLASFFTSSSMSVFALAMSNLYNIFLFIYAYIGTKMVYDRLSAKRSKVFAFILILVIILIAFSLSVQILALIGVFYSIYRNKIKTLNGR